MTMYIHATGNLGRDAETRATNNGKIATSFSIACKDGFGRDAATIWVDCTIWGERGEKVQPYLLKGTQVVVRGRPGLRTYDKGGQTVAVMTIMVDDVTLVGGRRDDARPAETERARPAARDDDGWGRETARARAPEFDDEVPF